MGQDDTPLIGEIATILRHVDSNELDYKIGLGNDCFITKSKVKLIKKVTVRTINKLVDFNQLCGLMTGWYHELRGVRRILADE